MSQDKPIPIDDLFLTWSERRTIADAVGDLLGTFKTKPHASKLQYFKNKVIEWSNHCATVEKARRKWEDRRARRERRIFRTPHLQDEKKIPREPGAFFLQFTLRDESCRAFKDTHEPLVGDTRSPFFGVMRGWFPASLDYDNAPPELCLPLPIPEDPPALHERFAALAAIHDCFGDARWKINPWAEVSEEDFEEQTLAHVSRFNSLKDVVKQCEESELCPWRENCKLSRQQEINKAALSAWLHDVGKDLQASVGAAALPVPARQEEPASATGSKKLPKWLDAKAIADEFGWDPDRVRSELSKAYYGPDGARSGKPAHNRAFWRADVPNAGGSQPRYIWNTILVIPHLESTFENTK